MFNTDLTLVIAVSTSFQNIVETYEITFNIGIGIGDTVPYASLCCQIYNDIGFIFVEYTADSLPICYRIMNENKSLPKSFQTFQPIIFQRDIVIVCNTIDTDNS